MFVPQPSNQPPTNKQLETACSSGTSCSSGKVAGLIFFEAFSFLWTSQVVGNVALATLAGGPYGSTLYRLYVYK
jgi:hypothetical protein